MCIAETAQLSKYWCSKVAAVSAVKNCQPYHIRQHWQALRKMANRQFVAPTPSWTISMPTLFGQAKQRDKVAVFVDNESGLLLPVAEDATSLFQWAVTSVQRQHNPKWLQPGSTSIPLTYSEWMEQARHQLEAGLHVSANGVHRGISCARDSYLQKFLEAHPELMKSSESHIGGRTKWSEKVHLSTYTRMPLGLANVPWPYCYAGDQFCPATLSRVFCF